MDYDLKSSIQVNVVLGFDTISSDTTTDGDIIDKESAIYSPFKSIVFTLVSGTITDGDYALKLVHGDESDLSDGVDVPATSLIGALPAYTDDADDDKSLSVGYIGKKRYVRASIVSTNTTSGGLLGVIAIKGNPSVKPTGA